MQCVVINSFGLSIDMYKLENKKSIFFGVLKFTMGVRQNSLFVINDAEKMKVNINLIGQLETNSPLAKGVRGIERNIKSIEKINKVIFII